jgi:hypothetical protein
MGTCRRGREATDIVEVTFNHSWLRALPLNVLKVVLDVANDVMSNYINELADSSVRRKVMQPKNDTSQTALCIYNNYITLVDLTLEEQDVHILAIPKITPLRP